MPSPRLQIERCSIDDDNELCTMSMFGNRSLLDIRDGNNVNCDIDNLTNRYSDRVDEAVKSKDRQPKMVAVHSTQVVGKGKVFTMCREEKRKILSKRKLTRLPVIVLSLALLSPL